MSRSDWVYCILLAYHRVTQQLTSQRAVCSADMSRSDWVVYSADMSRSGWVYSPGMAQSDPIADTSGSHWVLFCWHVKEWLDTIFCWHVTEWLSIFSRLVTEWPNSRHVREWMGTVFADMSRSDWVLYFADMSRIDGTVFCWHITEGLNIVFVWNGIEWPYSLHVRDWQSSLSCWHVTEWLNLFINWYLIYIAYASFWYSVILEIWLFLYQTSQGKIGAWV
jgi:hypothetical protein